MKPNQANTGSINGVNHDFREAILNRLAERQQQRHARSSLASSSSSMNDSTSTTLSDYLQLAIDISTATLAQESLADIGNDYGGSGAGGLSKLNASVSTSHASDPSSGPSSRGNLP